MKFCQTALHFMYDSSEHQRQFFPVLKGCPRPWGPLSIHCSVTFPSGRTLYPPTSNHIHDQRQAYEQDCWTQPSHQGEDNWKSKWMETQEIGMQGWLERTLHEKVNDGSTAPTVIWSYTETKRWWKAFTDKPPSKDASLILSRSIAISFINSFSHLIVSTIEYIYYCIKMAYHECHPNRIMCKTGSFWRCDWWPLI